MSNDQIKKLALNLLHADSEDDVIRILKDAGYWTDRKHWRLYGDKEGNYAQAGNQQSLAEAALVEKIINCVDARLMCECQLRDIPLESDDAPRSIRDAVAMFFENRRVNDDEAGTLANWAQAKRTEEARQITIAATGGRPRDRKQRKMCLTIVDQGEGQSPSRLRHTILSLNAKNKQCIRFVQGKFNMGGSGSLRFCGDQGLQLVISRRHPKLRDESDPQSSDWAITVVRREEPSTEIGEPIHSEFTYLAPVGADDTPRLGKVLSFSSDAMPLMPEHNKPYTREVEWGTAIKLYEYETSVGQSNILMPDGLLFALERLLPEIALPVRLHECRYEKAHSFDTTLAGLVVRLEEGRGDNLEPGFPHSAQLRVGGMSMKARIYAFKEEKAGTYLSSEGVIFSINGQAHGDLSKSIFSRPKAVGLPRLKNSLLVLVDCSTLSARQREDLFMSSRDRLSKKPIRYELDAEIAQMLHDNAELRGLQNRRRQQDVESKLSEQKPLEEVLGKVLRASPSLSSIFLKGQRLTKPFAGGGERNGGAGGSHGAGRSNRDNDFIGRRHPTFFRFKDIEYGKRYTRKCELGRRCRITFITDVENGYFERPADRGNFELTVMDASRDMSPPSYNVALESGRARLNMALPPEAEEDDYLVVNCTVTDPTLSDSFVNVATLTVVGKQKRRGNRDGDSKGGITLPEVISVREDDEHWRKHKFSPEVACHVISDPVDEDGDQLAHTFYINMANVSLMTEMKYSKQDPRLLEAKFKYGNVLLGLAMLHHAGNENGQPMQGESDQEDGPSVNDHIRTVSAAVAPVLLPMIDQLSGLNQDDLEVFGEMGDDD